MYVLWELRQVALHRLLHRREKTSNTIFPMTVRHGIIVSCIVSDVPNCWTSIRLVMLDSLKQKNIRTAICTDMTAHIQFRKILRLGIEHKIDCMVSSEEAGAEKASAVMYQTTLQKLGVLPAECVYIGDDYQRDIVGASRAGMKAIYLSNQTADHCVCCSNYREIRGYFETIGL